jgi:hypothetical protein
VAIIRKIKVSSTFRPQNNAKRVQMLLQNVWQSNATRQQQPQENFL